jgi:hypothetical protein
MPASTRTLSRRVRRGARFQYKRPGYQGPGHSTPGRRLSDTSRVSANKIRISIFSSVRSVNGAHGIRALEDIAEVDYTETHLNTLMKVTRAISTIAMTLIKVKLGTEYSV